MQRGRQGDFQVLGLSNPETRMALIQYPYLEVAGCLHGKGQQVWLAGINDGK